jgi:protein phosphatase
VGPLLAAQRDRLADTAAFTRAYQRYVRPTDGLTGLAVAPFQLLASRGATYPDRPHAWHLAVADRLVAADPELLRPTGRLFVGSDDVAGGDGLVGGADRGRRRGHGGEAG